MDAKAAAKSAARVKELRANEQKWSKPLMDAGWTAIPLVIFERQRALELDPLDVNIVLHLAGYWWTADNKPHPSKTRIADAIGVTARTVQRRIAMLEKAGYIRREERRIPGGASKTNLYHFDGLIKAALPLAQEKLTVRKKREEEEKARTKRKRPRLEIV